MSHRILFAYPEVSPLFPNGGIGTYVFEASHLLVRAGWKVDILTDSRYVPDITRRNVSAVAAAYGQAGIELIDLDRRGGQPWPGPDLVRAELYAHDVARLHAERHYDLIEFPDYRGPGFFLVRGKRTTDAFADTRLVAHLHASTEDITNWQEGLLVERDDFYARYMEEYVRKYADIVLSPTEYLLGAVRRTQPAFEKRLFRCGYPLSSPGSTLVSANTSTPRAEITVACISRLERRKGQDLLATAIRSIAERESLQQNVRFVFCGKDATEVNPDLSMARRVRTMLHGVPGWSIVAPKNRHDLQTWLASTVDVCVVPSRIDNYPNVILEAARAGCVLVCSDAGGIPEMLKDYGIDAQVFGSENAGDLSRAIDQAIERVNREPRMRKRLAEAFEQTRREQCTRSLATYEEMALVESSRPAGPSRPRSTAVSIVIASSTVDAQVQASVDAAFQSRYPDFEVVVATDQTQTPDGRRLLNGLRTAFTELRVIQVPSAGRADLLNAGIGIARGDFIAPVFPGDRVLPDLLGRCSLALAHRPRLSYITTYSRAEKGRAFQPRWPFLLPQPLGAVEPLMLFEDSLGAPVVMFRRAALESAGGYSGSLTAFEEWDLWLKLHEAGFEGDVIPEVHVLSDRCQNRESRGLDVFQNAAAQQSLLRRHQSLAERNALAVAGIVLHEQWTRARGPGGDAAHNLEQAWTYLKSGILKLGREVRDPQLPTGRWARKIARQLENLLTTSGTPGRVRPQ